MNYFELYPGDYRRDTARLSLSEHGAYTLLLADYYSGEKPLPAAYVELYRITGAQGASEQKAVRSVADTYFPIDAADGLRHNPRADREIEKAQKRINRARENGKKGGRPPEPSNNPAGNPAGSEIETQRVSQQGTQWQTHSGEALHTPHAIPLTDIPSRPKDLEGRALEPGLPEGTDPEAWEAWAGHQQTQRKWSAQRQMQALGHLRLIVGEGGNPTEVLRWALSRSLADLLDCHRRMKLDAAKQAADSKLPGESLADASYRQSTATRQNEATNAAELPLTAALLAIGGSKR